MQLGAWQHVPGFLAVAEHRSFTRAARALGVSTSALSQAVRALETKVGVPLLHRTTRSVSLTTAGEQLRARAAPAVRQVREALETASTPAGELSGELRVTVPGLALPTVVAPMLERFTRRHPRVRLDVTVESRLANIVAERYDAGIRLIEATDRDMVTTRLSGAFRFVVVGNPAYLKQRGVPGHPRELGAHALIGFRSPTNGTITPWDLEKRGRVWKVAVKGPITTNHEGLLLDAAVRGLGLAYVAEFSAQEALARGTLRIVLEDWATEVPGFFLYYPSRRQASPNLRAFIACAKPG